MESFESQIYWANKYGQIYLKISAVYIKSKILEQEIDENFNFFNTAFLGITKNNRNENQICLNVYYF